MEKRTDEAWRIAMLIHRGELTNTLAAERIEAYGKKMATEAVEKHKALAELMDECDDGTVEDRPDDDWLK